MYYTVIAVLAAIIAILLVMVLRLRTAYSEAIAPIINLGPPSHDFSYDGEEQTLEDRHRDLKTRYELTLSDLLNEKFHRKSAENLLGETERRLVDIQTESSAHKERADAFEIGIDEQAESYEMMFLSKNEIISTLSNSMEILRWHREEDENNLKRLFAFADRHQKFCPSQYEEVLQDVDREFLKTLEAELFPTEADEGQ